MFAAVWPLYRRVYAKASSFVSAPILVTGAAGFVGFHVAQRLLRGGAAVLGVDNLNAYYDPSLKHARLALLAEQPGFQFQTLDLADVEGVAALFADQRPQTIVHLAAQAGVRYSLQNPRAYLESNLSGFMNVLEGCRHAQVGNLIYASSSSVYGANRKLPFAVGDPVDHPVSLYAATKKSNELMAHAYAHLYRIPVTGLRFFTVYGPWGRPDMAYWIFTKAILEGRPVNLFNAGQMRRDFTYIDDVVEAIVRLIDQPAAPNPAWRAEAPDAASSNAPYRLYNIGNHSPVNVRYFLSLIEQACGKQAVIDEQPMQPGDVLETFADVEALSRAVDFQPSTPIERGVAEFVAWYRDYHKI